jgi:hypothetical protein
MGTKRTGLSKAPTPARSITTTDREHHEADRQRLRCLKLHAEVNTSAKTRDVQRLVILSSMALLATMSGLLAMAYDYWYKAVPSRLQKLVTGHATWCASTRSA